MNATRLVRENFNATSVAFLTAIAVTALLDTKICNLFLIVYSSLWIYYQFQSGLRVEQWHYAFLFIFCGYYVLGVTGLTHSDNLKQGLHWLEAKAPFFAFPVLAAFAPLGERDINRVLTFFSIALIPIGLALLAFAARCYLDTGEIDSFTYIRFLGPLKLHPSYFSFFTAFAVIHLYARRNEVAETRAAKAFLFAGIAALVLFNFLALSRTGIFAFLLVFAVFFLFKLLSGKATSKSYWILFVVLGLLVVATIPLIKERFKLFQITDPLGEETINSTAFHIKSWYCALESLSNFHFFTGYGTGDEKDVLVACYEKYDWQIMAKERYNAHNEYLSVMMRHGVTGIVVFLGMICYPLVHALRAREFVYVGFLVLFSILSLAGSLNLYHGIVFYSLINALLFRKLMIQSTTSLRVDMPLEQEPAGSLRR